VRVPKKTAKVASVPAPNAWEKRAKAAEARADTERKARIAAEAVAAKAKTGAVGAEDDAGELSAEQADKQKSLRAELKELKAVSPALHGRFFGGADGHAAAVQVIQDELTTIAAAKRGGMPLHDQLDSQRRFVDACVKADAVAVSQLDKLLAERVELDEQIDAGRSAREKAAEKRAAAEAHLAELHSRMALEAGPAAAAAARPPAITVEDSLLFMGILQHVDSAAIRATCQATGGESADQVSNRVAALTAKLCAIAAAAAASAPPAGARASGSAEVVVARPAVPEAAVAAAADAGDGDDDQSMLLDAEDQEQLDQIVDELDNESLGAGGAQLPGRAELRKRLVQQTARMVSKRLKGKKGP
jgi:hypothetical protein